MIESLIAAAISLILAAQTPNIPVELKVQALQTAQLALDFAKNYQATVPAASVPVIPAPVLETAIVPATTSIEIWQNSNVIADETESGLIDVSGFHTATLSFAWQAFATSTHQCQYRYQRYDSEQKRISDSTFVYFSDADPYDKPQNCRAVATIPLDAKYVRIGSWTPANGQISAALQMQ